SVGVSRVLSGDGKPIVPADTPRQARRTARQRSEVGDPTSEIVSPVARDGLMSPATPSNGRSAAGSAKNGKLSNGKPANGKAANGKPSNGNGKSNGNTAAARIVALRIVDGVPIHSDHVTGHVAGNGNGVGHAGATAPKRRNGSTNGKTV